MNTHRKWTIGICLATTLAVIFVTSSWTLCGTVQAAPLKNAITEDGPARPLRMFFSGQFGRLLELRSELDLTTEQRHQIRDILANHRAEIATSIKPVVEKRRALREATLAQDADEAAIRSAAADLGKAIGDAAVVGSRIKSQVRAVLTPGQQKKVDEFRVDTESAVDSFLNAAAQAN